mmetsp:Transcript_20205/g.61512  ORF Transcript_20205/g.61512 Transcript_20205/m.61512 type:complete len:82 (-) Transcript_20205:168-413(-)
MHTWCLFSRGLFRIVRHQLDPQLELLLGVASDLEPIARDWRQLQRPSGEADLDRCSVEAGAEAEVALLPHDQATRSAHALE